MMPIGVPKVAYRVPGSASADWVDIYNRLYRERIIFLGQEIDDDYANQIIGVLLVRFVWRVGEWGVCVCTYRPPDSPIPPI